MVIFSNSNPNLSKFWRAWKENVGKFYVWSFGIFYGHVLYFMAL
jgi:hypothetical protein